MVEMFAARWLGPAEYGTWATLLLVATYAGNLHLGVLNAVGREIPINMAGGNNNVLVEIKTTGFIVTYWTIIIFSILVVSYIFIGGNSFPAIGLLLLIIYYIGQQLYQFYQYVFRSELKFTFASLQQGVTGILITTFALSFLATWQLNGMIAGYGIALSIGALLFSKRSYFIHISPLLVNMGMVLHLFKIGFPIMMVGFSYAVFTSVDRWIVLSFLGKIPMGYYSFAYNIFSVGMLLLTLLATQFYPRLSLAYGKNEVPEKTLAILKWQIKVAGLMSISLSILIALLIPVIVNNIMPHYSPSIRVVQILSLGIPFIGISLGISGYFNVIGQQRYLFWPMGMSMFLNIILSIILIKAGAGLIGVALSTVLSYMVYCVALLYNTINHQT